EKYGAELVEIVAAYRQQNHLQEVVPPTPHRTETEEKSEKSSRKDSAVPTRLLSLELFLEKLSLEEIAQKRNLTLSTIEGHLANCIEKGEITVDRLLSPAALDVIQQKLKKLPHERLREIKEALNDEYSYGQIKFALAHKNLSGESDT
ncbi:MAG: helix-turn-helix domain-containing protein, partial [Desulforhopalus sp.]